VIIRRYSAPTFVSTQADARAQLDVDYAAMSIVQREHLRGVVFHCPCGCFDTIAINLDKGTGPAWRVRIDPEGVTLLPSVWRPTGCRSHFIVWKGRVWWCRLDDEDADWPSDLTSEIRDEWAELRRRARR
jgi:hypothetical protein